jgi:hypothetical protein
MRAYFVRIAAVRLAARLLGKTLVDNYGFHGALPKFGGLALKNIKETEGIDNVSGKAGSFNFGTLCARAIEKVLGNPGEDESLFLDALTARNLFLDLSPEKRAAYTDAELEESLRLIFSVLLKKAQIRTHTAKPGDEDIHSWLAGYYRLEQDYEPFISRLTGQILSPDPLLEKKHPSFFSRDDALVALALAPAAPSPEAVKAAAGKEPGSVFGQVLQEIVRGTL